MPSEPLRLCALSDLGDPGTLEAVAERGGERFSIIVVQKDGRVFAYQNACPHLRVPLNWQPDEFLDSKREVIECSMHGARFRIEDGYCLAGPCRDRSLTPVPVAVERGYVVLATADVGRPVT